MRLLIFGGSGMLGHKLVQSLSRSFDVSYTLHGDFDNVGGFEIFDRDRAFENLDVIDMGSVRRVLEKSRPDVVINSVGIIKQRPEADDVEISLSVNSIFPHRLARLSREFGFRLITISTDCVFSGFRGMYSEQDTPDSLDLYGQSKHWGEIESENCLTLRTSIIGRELTTQHSLIEWIISRRGGSVNGYSKAIYSGFPTLVFADILNDIIERHRELFGIFHVSSEPINKFELLEKVNDRFGLDVAIFEETEFVIDRSLNSSKFREATGFEPPSWDEMVDLMAADPTPYDKWKGRTN